MTTRDRCPEVQEARRDYEEDMAWEARVAWEAGPDWIDQDEPSPTGKMDEDGD
jgi:hypothetical protein